jgi:multiple sugar transport system ATP-binding protein
MNFLPATSAGPGLWEVAGLTLAGPAAASGAFDLAVRPEDVSVAPGGFKAVVHVVEPLGAHILVTCAVGNIPFRAVLDSDIKVSVGDGLSFVPRRDRIRWFDARTGLAAKEELS